MLPSKLKAMNLFNDAASYMGEIAEVVLPKLTRKMEEWRGGGMARPIMADMGGEALQLEWTCGGFMRGVIEQYGVTTHDGVQLRFCGSYRAEDKADPMAVEVVVRGRHSEIDPGTAKVGDDTAFKVVTQVSYYKLTIDGQDVIEIDVLGMVEKVNGVDRLLKDRKALGLA